MKKGLNMCKYCDLENSNEPILHDLECKIDIDHGILDFLVRHDKGIFFTNVEINHCPMCGKQLREHQEIAPRIFCNTSVDDAKSSIRMAERDGPLDAKTLKANIEYEKKKEKRTTLIKFFEGKLKKLQKGKNNE